jgi:hypothetical protein
MSMASCNSIGSVTMTACVSMATMFVPALMPMAPFHSIGSVIMTACVSMASCYSVGSVTMIIMIMPASVSTMGCIASLNSLFLLKSILPVMATGY